MLSIMLAASNDFVTTVFPVLRYIFLVLIFISSITMIITTLMQSSADENGATAVTGQESYYSQNKGESRDGKLKRITTICAIIIATCTVLYFVSLLINGYSA
ncbi:MAG: preprotein translocase subunit SecG [Clostridia bacterium]|nr:preprotein translocase subunit SecG [Clostridia bacterium]